jgi:hypothetical protein
VERRLYVEVEDAELAARRKLEEIFDFFTALGYSGKVIELRNQIQVLAWVSWEKKILTKIRNPEGTAA